RGRRAARSTGLAGDARALAEIARAPRGWDVAAYWQAMPTRRQPLRLALALCGVVLLLGGIWLGGHPDELPRFARTLHVAARARLKPGDVIVAVNGRKLAGLPAEAAATLIKGPPGTNVTLAVREQRAGRTLARTVLITRALISEPVVSSAVRTDRGIKLGI